MAAGKNNKQVIIKSCALLTDCINEINSTQVDNAKYLCIIIPMSNSIEYSNNYLKMPESFTAILQRDEPDDDITIMIDFKSFEFKPIFRNNTDNDDDVNVEIAISLKH